MNSMETIRKYVAEGIPEFDSAYRQATVDISKLRYLLYEAIVELNYVQSIENCDSGLCASPKGEEIVNRGMELLGVRDLSTEHLENP
jgi:hypothetical protein